MLIAHINAGRMDARPLPIYVNYDGMICTVTLLQVIDDYSWYPVMHRLIPRKIRDEEGLPEGADFTPKEQTSLQGM